MKRKLFILAIIVIIVFAAFFAFKRNQAYNNYKNYADFMLNRHLPAVCQNMIEMNAIIEKALEKGYISEIELTALKRSYDIYISSFHRYVELVEYTKDFTFQGSYRKSDDYKIGFEYSKFFRRIDELFADKARSDATGYTLTAAELDVFKQSHNYTAKVSEIIKQKIDYYNMFNLEQVTIENTISYAWRVKEEYKQPMPPNMARGAAEVSVDGSTKTVELENYLAPEKPHFDSAEDTWLELLKEIQKLNREKL